MEGSSGRGVECEWCASPLEASQPQGDWARRAHRVEVPMNTADEQMDSPHLCLGAAGEVRLDGAVGWAARTSIGPANISRAARSNHGRGHAAGNLTLLVLAQVPDGFLIDSERHDGFLSLRTPLGPHRGGMHGSILMGLWMVPAQAEWRLGCHDRKPAFCSRHHSALKRPAFHAQPNQ